MNKLLTVVAIAVALALPQGAFAQGCPLLASDLRVTAQIYSNVVEVLGGTDEFVSNCYVTVRVRSAGGDIVAEESAWLPDTRSDNWTCNYPAENANAYCSDNNGSWSCDSSLFNNGRTCNTDNDWRTGYAAFFLTDWNEKAEFFGLQPGQSLEVGTNAAFADAPANGGGATNFSGTVIADLGFTRIAPTEDVLEGYLKPRKDEHLDVSFLGFDMNSMVITPAGPAEGSPICFEQEIAVKPDGTFSKDFTGECNMLRNGAMLVAYYKKNFRIYRFQHIPGYAAVIDTPFALMSGEMFVPYRAHLSDKYGSHKAWSSNQPAAWLNLGLFQFSRHNKAVPIRKGDRLHVSEFAPDGGLTNIQENVPKFGVAQNAAPEIESLKLASPHASAVAPLIEEKWWAITAPPGQKVCFVCVGCHTDGSIPPGMACDQANSSGKILLGPPEDGMDGAVAVMQRKNGLFYIAHKGLQKPISYLLSESPFLPSMYNFIPWLFCDALGIGQCSIENVTESPRLVRAELTGYLKKH